MYNRGCNLYLFCNYDKLPLETIQSKLSHPRQITSVSIQAWMFLSTLPLYWISKHDDDFGTGLDCVDEVLGQERRLCLFPVSMEIAPGLVVPHRGGTGFTCQDIDSLSNTLGNNSSFKMQWVVHMLSYNNVVKLN